MPCPPHSDLVTGPWPPGSRAGAGGAGCVHPRVHSCLLLAAETSTRTQKQREGSAKPTTLPLACPPAKATSTGRIISPAIRQVMIPTTKDPSCSILGQTMELSIFNWFSPAHVHTHIHGEFR